MVRSLLNIFGPVLRRMVLYRSLMISYSSSMSLDAALTTVLIAVLSSAEQLKLP